ncbi:MAG: sirtuin [Chitinophagaceae bacterium BSSC1]|nr:MAG: sirtuin [Chitinophagaceae bacterium BSSC1]
MDNSVVVVTGAGISVDSGIQPFRGKNGLWNENPTTMATYEKFKTDPGHFLSWYYHRFVSCRDALPNATHEILAANQIRVITQNVDNLHIKAAHSTQRLIEIHGNINFKRRIPAYSKEELVLANWDFVKEAEDQIPALFELFEIGKHGTIDFDKSYRPHILLFDEYYTDLYETETAMDWAAEAETIIFMGTSNSVGITNMVLESALRGGKEVIVVDPNPAPSLRYPGIQIFAESAMDFSKRYF